MFVIGVDNFVVQPEVVRYMPWFLPLYVQYMCISTATKFMIGVGIRIPAASLCTNRRLYHIVMERSLL